MFYKKSTYLNENGEVINEKLEKVRVWRDNKYLFRAKNYQSRMYQDVKLKDVVKNNSDRLRIYDLATEIYKDTNIIAYQYKSRQKRIADIDDISNMIGLSIKKTREFLNRMKKLHIIAERIDNVGDTTTIKYIINPLFFSSNKWLSADLYLLFEESLQFHVPEWTRLKFNESKQKVKSIEE